MEDVAESSETTQQGNKIKADTFEINKKPILHKDVAKSLNAVNTIITTKLDKDEAEVKEIKICQL